MTFTALTLFNGSNGSAPAASGNILGSAADRISKSIRSLLRAPR
jgi:hypothetical protein